MANMSRAKKHKNDSPLELPEETSELSLKIEEMIEAAKSEVGKVEDKGGHIGRAFGKLFEVIKHLASAVSDDQVLARNERKESNERYQREVQPLLNNEKVGKINDGMKVIIEQAKQASNSIRFIAEGTPATLAGDAKERYHTVLKATDCEIAADQAVVTPKKVIKIDLKGKANKEEKDGRQGKESEHDRTTYIIDCENFNDRKAIVKQLKAAKNRVVIRPNMPKYLHSFMTALRKKILEVEKYKDGLVWVKLNRECDKIVILFKETKQSNDWTVLSTAKLPYPTSLVNDITKQQCKLDLVSVEALNDCIPKDFN